MMKLLFILSLLVTLHASNIEFNYSNVKMEDFSVSYILDKNSSLSINQVESMEFNIIKNKHAFSGQTGATWYKIDLENKTDLDKKIFLHNNLAYFSKKIDIFTLNDNFIQDKHFYNVLENKSTNKLFGSTLVHKVTIPAKDIVSIYIKNTPMVTNLFDLNIYDERASINALSNKDFYSIIIIAIMITLALYNATLYFFNQRKEFLFYALYMITPAIGLNYKYGTIFSQFHLYGESTYWLNLTAIVMPAFLILFVQQVLHTKILNKNINFFLNSLLLLVGIDVAIAIFIDLTFAMEVFKFIFFLTTIVIIYLIIYLFKTSHPLALIFASAYSFYFSGLLITIFAMSGLIELNFYTFRSGGMGLILEGLLFSYLMHYNIKLLEKEIREQREVIIVKNKKAQLGDMISAITHQWKQPLARIASITGLIEFQLSNESIISPKKLTKHISQINSNIFFLSNTIDDFKNFFNSDQEKIQCDIKSLIEKAILISKDDTLTKEVTITTEFNFINTIDIYQNELLHILLNIIQNAKEAFKDSNENIKLIKIIAYTENEHTYIDIIDNAGGIDEKNMPFIFNEYYTTKQEKSGSGLGLYLSKIILEDRLEGHIEAINIKDGTMFRIIL
ncbi:sensor histidine kinase [Sulfurimonas sp.]|nr:sensor histidine kinase [Sulfurimonas sp.]